MDLVVDRTGTILVLYNEALDLRRLGQLTITRASRVEPDSRGDWHADLTPVGGPVLGPFSQRSQALDAETAWLEAHRLSGSLNASR
jgi:hypothetical protein